MNVVCQTNLNNNNNFKGANSTNKIFNSQYTKIRAFDLSLTNY